LAKPLLVLDTNVVLDLFHFDDEAARPLRAALEDGHARCGVSTATLAELRQVLTYPHFALDAARQDALFVRYAALAELRAAPMETRLPRCSDPDDQKFLELAAASGAGLLVSKDRALLKLRRRCAFGIATPREASSWLVAAA
jgi:putative PIN family toxin of toxin-antitoxin system